MGNNRFADNIRERIEQWFGVSEKGSSLKREMIGGVTTYMTLAYIVFVQPVVLSAAGMDFGAVLNATCIASAIACMIMGLVANYPIALAPAMGHNFYFAYTVVLGMGIEWQAALAATFAAGVLFFCFSMAGLRQKVMNALPSSLMNAIGCGIGLMIALIGLEWSGIIVDTPGTLVGLGDLSSPPVLLALFALGMTSILFVKRVAGTILIAILLTTTVGLIAGMIDYHGIISKPPSITATMFKLNFKALLSFDMAVIVAIFFGCI